MKSKMFDNSNRENNLTDLGFGEEVGYIQLGMCPFCKNPVKDTEFKDALSRKEFDISGVCQTCQDKVFGAPDGGLNDGNHANDVDNSPDDWDWLTNTRNHDC